MDGFEDGHFAIFTWFLCAVVRRSNYHNAVSGHNAGSAHKASPTPGQSIAMMKKYHSCLQQRSIVSCNRDLDIVMLTWKFKFQWKSKFHHSLNFTDLTGNF